MISATILRAAPGVLRNTAGPTFTCSAKHGASTLFLSGSGTGCRQLSTSSVLRSSLTAKHAHKEATTPHKRELQLFANFVSPITNVLGQLTEDLPGSSSSQISQLTKHDAVSTVPFRGDWVLFHPVYTPEELKAVQVRLSD